jgi:cyanoexosortase A
VNTTICNLAKLLQGPQFWLFAIAVNLIGIHVLLTWRLDAVNQVGNGLLLWIVALYLVWHKRQCLRLESGFIASLFGSTLLATILLKSAFVNNVSGFFFFWPLMVSLALALIASGFRGLMQYGPVFGLLFCLGGPQALLRATPIDMTVSTAQFAAYLLWYLGFDSSRQGTMLAIGDQRVLVYPGCSGLESMTQMLGLAVVFIVLFPMPWLNKILVTLVATTIGFVVNGCRVVVMTTLLSTTDKAVFDYWHEGNGSLIFSIISAFLFGLFCLFLIHQDEIAKLE